MKNTQGDILNFWFVETQPSLWFQINPDFDAIVRSRFLTDYEIARAGQYDDWKSSPDGCLALCLLLDQFPRNIFRGNRQAYATDSKAILIAKHAIAKGFDQVFQPIKRRFLYLPFEHSEILSDQKRAVELFESIREEDPVGYEYALRYFKVIDRFNRFPHRNKILDRENTPEEQEFLQITPSGF